MGYRNDGFFGIDWPNDGSVAGKTNNGALNPSFKYPDKSIRFLEAQAKLQSKFNSVKDTLARGDYKLHRGYIRNLEQPQFSDALPISRCNFQFNPQEIRQSVAMREDMYIPLLQTVEQLAQPIGAVVNFTFDLMFDRSHELSAGSLSSPTSGMPPYSGIEERRALRGRGGSSDLEDPYDVGVLGDLKALYAAIGQGFSEEMLEFQKKRFLNKQDYDESNAPEPSNAEGEDSSATSTQSKTVTEVDVDRILQANYGNWGLLMPNPVRVMFSSLFMLDGFITGTNVDFLKFNTKMVPIMCRVTLNMSAMYIGFAKQTTFIGSTFRDAADAQAAQDRENEEVKKEILKALKSTGRKFTISANEPNNWDKAAINNIDPYPIYGLVVNDVASSLDVTGDQEVDLLRGLFLGFPNAVPKPGSSDYTTPDGRVIEGGRDDDNILRLFEDTTSLSSFKYEWEISIYGPITASNKLTTKQSADKLISGDAYKSDSKIKLVGKYSGTESASTKDEWGRGEKGQGKKVRRREYKGPELTNQAASGSDFAIHKYISSSEIANFVITGYYIVEISVVFTLAYGTDAEIQVEEVKKISIKGDAQLRESIFPTWR